MWWPSILHQDPDAMESDIASMASVHFCTDACMCTLVHFIITEEVDSRPHLVNTPCIGTANIHVLYLYRPIHWCSESNANI